MLDAERVGITGNFERGSLIASIARCGCYLPRPKKLGQTIQDLGQICIDTRHRRTAPGSRKIAVLAIRGTALGDMELPIGARRYGLQLASAVGSNHNRQSGFRTHVLLVRRAAAEPSQTVPLQFDDL